MRTKMKALVLSLCAVLLVVTTVFVTMAYLTSQDKVTNTFTYGKVEITLDEADVKTDGTYEKDKNERVEANEYKLIPGRTYIKDPTVHVAEDSEDCWLFVKVENGLVNAEATDTETEKTTIASQMAAQGWTLVTGTTNIYAYKEIVSAKDNVVVFESFKVAGSADVSKFENAKIVITAYAIQADGFTTSDAAWTIAGSEAQGN